MFIGDFLKRILLASCLVTLVSGCATPAQISMPAISKAYSSNFDDKTMSVSVLYSQPKPGIFSGGEQLPLVLLSEAEMSVASASTLQKLPDYVLDQLPSSMKLAKSGKGDYNMIIEITARDKKGPTYFDYEAGKSFAKGMLTFGFGSSEYDIVADFDACYKLSDNVTPLFSKCYKVNDSVDHQRGQLESFNSLNDYAGQLLEKHINLTLNDFFKSSISEI